MGFIVFITCVGIVSVGILHNSYEEITAAASAGNGGGYDDTAPSSTNLRLAQQIKDLQKQLRESQIRIKFLEENGATDRILKKHHKMENIQTLVRPKVAAATATTTNATTLSSSSSKIRK